MYCNILFLRIFYNINNTSGYFFCSGIPFIYVCIIYVRLGILDNDPS